MSDAYDEVADQFQEWVEQYVADVGDAAIATARLKVLTTVKRSIANAMTDLDYCSDPTPALIEARDRGLLTAPVVRTHTIAPLWYVTERGANYVGRSLTEMDG